jgi:hypothetical protein
VTPMPVMLKQARLRRVIVVCLFMLPFDLIVLTVFPCDIRSTLQSTTGA